ncbi:hypothetical protein BRC89_05095 [Halobacteriales archaeon QS_4_70_19]|nr:MAG: hypothetical protein BRC89_05095 [Halobacteriales archaeon QS_4_70_19]
MRGVAINVGANTNEPGFRAPVDGDGQFDFVPIPEPEPTREDVHVPTYGELDEHLDLAVGVSDVADIPVHLDPTFDRYPFCEGYTYGDPYGAKAGPISGLEAGDFLFFYATLDTPSEGRPDWQPPDWGAFLVGHFRLARDPLGPEAYQEAGEATRDVFANNAHVKRESFDAQVLVQGDAWGSELYDAAVPLSTREAGVDANRLVTALSADSGKGPWWRRPLRFDHDATQELLDIHGTREWARCFDD